MSKPDLETDALLRQATEEDPLDFRRAFRRVRWSQKITLFLVVNAAGALIWAALRTDPARYVLLVAGTVAAVAAAGFYGISWRCPNCNRHLGLGVGSHCRYCAARLR